jgi:hypothetical protein
MPLYTLYFYVDSTSPFCFDQAAQVNAALQTRQDATLHCPLSTITYYNASISSASSTNGNCPLSIAATRSSSA